MFSPTTNIVFIRGFFCNVLFDPKNHWWPEAVQECLDSLWGLLEDEAIYDTKIQKKVVTKEQFIGNYGEPSPLDAS